ncbi:protein arginine N-methyltransferase 1 [Drosophila guanche]|uniref:type I protein arginine methyltransferase n=1 Tax=Drosophila guanche TaxID=7266 RepID=A0A3B0JNY5_DROGU|nr:protein arginine N-methyltransferase 1 [Drosophila guanche]SPP83944.1 blast:Protein arginine N-methyltransferase 3 [Drosophila guanche]
MKEAEVTTFKSQEEEALETKPADASSDDDDYDDMDDDDDEKDQGEEPTTCLFCPEVLPSIGSAIEHLDSSHKVNLSQLQKKFQMDQYSFIKLINYIRVCKISAEQLLSTEQILWDDEKYLKPVEYEPWLCYDYETLKAEKEFPTVPELLQRIAEQSKLLQQANEDMERMRKDYKELLQRVHDGGDGKDGKTVTKDLPRNNLSLDKEYFNSYSHFGIHHEMLSDWVRTNSYRSALLLNSEDVRGKTVLDVGCGTGILSIFASQAGASRIVGIDNSEIVYTAMDIVRKNNVKNIELVKGRLEDTELPEAKYDIIISEWMGYFLLYESMLDSIIYAREHHLNPNGIILPNRCSLSLMGYGCDKLYAEQVEFWSDVYGVNMGDLAKRSIEEPLMQTVDARYVLTSAEQIANFDMMTVDLNYSNFTYEFSLKCTQAGRLSAFVGFFDTFFELPRQVMFSTSPYHTSTHWKQTVFFIDQPQEVSWGDVIKGKIISRRNTTDVRALNVEIQVFGKTYKYTVD